MTRQVLSALLAMLTISSASGCGTCFNYLGAEKAGPRQDQEFGKIYGGVRFELVGMESGIARLKNPESPGVLPGIEELLGMSLLMLDMPLTAVGDTLTLPLTISYTLQCQTLPVTKPPCEGAALPE